MDWLRRTGAEPVLELVPDDELLTVCDSQPDPAQEEELSELLERNQEGTLSETERGRLEELLRGYRAARGRWSWPGPEGSRPGPGQAEVGRWPSCQQQKRMFSC